MRCRQIGRGCIISLVRRFGSQSTDLARAIAVLHNSGAPVSVGSCEIGTATFTEDSCLTKEMTCRQSGQGFILSCSTALPEAHGQLRGKSLPARVAEGAVVGVVAVRTMMFIAASR